MEKTGLIPEDQKQRLIDEFREKMVNPVRLIMFTQEVECQFCSETRQLIGELASLSDRVKMEVYDFVADAEKARMFGVEKIPALVIMAVKDYGMRFYGFPYGYEFRTLIDAILFASSGRTDLAEGTKQKIREINVPVSIQVFVTLTCPHCSSAATIANQFAVENGLIRAEIIEANEFPHLAIKYGVMGVPKIVVNDKVEFVGAVPENLFLEQVLSALR
jgi:glutaredoxin-like protein